MQTAILNKVAETGWAGRTADKIQQSFGAPSRSSFRWRVRIFLRRSRGAADSVQRESDAVVERLRGGSAESTDRLSALQSLLTFDTGLSLVQAASTTTGMQSRTGRR